MKTNKLFAMAAFACGLAMSMTSCSNDDNPVDGKTTATVIVSFEKQALNADNYWIGEENANGIDNGWGGKIYPNYYEEAPLTVYTIFGVTYWTGFAISGSTTSAYDANNFSTDQYNIVTGKAHTGNNYLIAQGEMSYNGESIKVNGSKGAWVKGFWYTNSSYTANSILNGDSYSGPKFETTDWLKLTVTGTRVDGTKATVDIDLAKDGDYVKDWQYADLSSLGKVTELAFTFSGSRNGEWGLNTPAYVGIDDITVEVEK